MATVLFLLGALLLAALLYRIHLQAVRKRAAREKQRAEAKRQAELDARQLRVMETVRRNHVRQKVAKAPPVDTEVQREAARARLTANIAPEPRWTGHGSSNIAYTERPPAPANNAPDDYLYVPPLGLSSTFLNPAAFPTAPSIQTVESEPRCSANDASDYNTSTTDYSSSYSDTSSCSSE